MSIHDVNIGIELASEHADRATRNIIVRNNLVYDTTAIGLAIGGYDRRRGSTESCTLVNNTVVRSAGPAVLVQFDTRDNLIANNVIVAAHSHVFVENAYVAERRQRRGPQPVLRPRTARAVAPGSGRASSTTTSTAGARESGNDQRLAVCRPGVHGPGSGDYTIPRARRPLTPDFGLRWRVPSDLAARSAHRGRRSTSGPTSLTHRSRVRPLRSAALRSPSVSLPGVGDRTDGGRRRST